MTDFSTDASESATDQPSATPPHGDSPAADPAQHASGTLSDGSDGESTDVATVDEPGIEDITGQVEQPAKVMRIGTMIKQLLEEVRAAPLDEAGRKRLREIHETSVRELSDGLAPELRDELDRLSIPFGSETPSEAELRIAQAQLVGWLEGLFHGIQTALYAQQAAARAQLEEMRRRALPGGEGGQPVIVGPGGQMIVPGASLRPEDDPGQAHGTGQYL